MNMIKKLMLLALAIPSLAVASSGVHLDKANYDLNDKASLQRGAATFVNYCLNCHSASYMRYNRMKDFGLTDVQIKENLLFAADKVGETMTVAMRQPEAKVWFGAAPPDLTVIARSRGADWLYSYLRGFYRDDTRATGWNNTVFDKVGMPHVLYQLQGEQVMKTEKHGDHETHTLTLAKPGSMTAPAYDATVIDLVNYLVYMGDPAQQTRKMLGIIVLLFLGIFFVIAYYLKKEFWKDIH